MQGPQRRTNDRNFIFSEFSHSVRHSNPFYSVGWVGLPLHETRVKPTGSKASQRGWNFQILRKRVSNVWNLKNSKCLKRLKDWKIRNVRKIRKIRKNCGLKLLCLAFLELSNFFKLSNLFELFKLVQSFNFFKLSNFSNLFKLSNLFNFQMFQWIQTGM